MRRIKNYVFSVLAVLLACSIGFVSCNPDKDEPEPITVKEFKVNADDVVKAFISGQDGFSADNLVVTARYSNEKKAKAVTGYKITGYEKYVNEEGKLALDEDDGNKVEVKITVSYEGKSSYYYIVISKPVDHITVNADGQPKEFFVGDDINIAAVSEAEEGEDQEAGVIVKAFYTEDDDEEGEVVTTGVTFTAVDNTVSGTTNVKASYLGKESEEFEVKVYKLSGIVSTEFKEEADVPKIASIKVLLGDTEVEGASVAYYSNGAKYTEDTFVAGDYAVIATVGDFTKELTRFSVVESTEKNFKIITDGSKIDGAAVLIKLDVSAMNLIWANDLEKATPSVTVTGASLGNEAPMFTDPQGDPLSSCILKVVLSTGGVKNVSVNFSNTFKGITYSGKVDFVDGNLIPSNYKPTALTVTSSATKLGLEGTAQFTAKDTTYGLDYTSDVYWTIEGEAYGSSISDDGLFTAGSDLTEAKDVKVVATLKSNAEVKSEPVTVTIDPAKEDTSGIYDVELTSDADTGAWVRVIVKWTEDKYKIKDVTKANFSLCGLNAIVAKTSEEGQYKFQLNAASAAFRGTSGTISFRVSAEDGNYYDVTVAYTETGYNPPSAAGTYEVTGVTIEEAVLNPKLMLSEESVDVQKDGDAVTVTVDYDEIAEFDATKLSAVSDNEAVKVTISGTTLSITGTVVTDTPATVTVTYDNNSSITATLKVNVAEVVEVAPYKITVENIVGAGGEFTFAWSDAKYALEAKTDSIVDFKFGNNSKNGVGWCDSRKGTGTVTAYMHTIGADWGGDGEKDFYCRVQAANSALCDINGTLKISGGKGSVTNATFDFVALITVDKSSVQFDETGSSESVTVSAIGFDFDASKVSAVSSDTGVATVSVSDGVVTITSVAEGDATITVSYDQEGIENKTIAVHVGARENVLKNVNPTAQRGDTTISVSDGVYTATSASPSGGDWDNQIFFAGDKDALADGESVTSSVTVTVNKSCTLVYKVEWNLDFTATGEVSHTFAEAGTYTFEVSGTVSSTHNEIKPLFALRSHEAGLELTIKDMIIYKN